MILQRSCQRIPMSTFVIRNHRFHICLPNDHVSQISSIQTPNLIMIMIIIIIMIWKKKYSCDSLAALYANSLQLRIFTNRSLSLTM